MGMEDRQSPVIHGARGERGFSLIEVLIAAGILLMVSLGVLPIFAQAIVNNRAGADYTQATNYAKSELERLYSLPFSSPDLQVTGAETVRNQYFSVKDEKWVDGATVAADDAALWRRITTIRQYGVGGLVDVNHDGTLDGPLPEGTDAAFIHAKEIEVRVESGRGSGLLAGGKRITLRILKVY